MDLTFFIFKLPFAVSVKPRRPKIMQCVPATGHEKNDAISCHKPLPEYQKNVLLL